MNSDESSGEIEESSMMTAEVNDQERARSAEVVPVVLFHEDNE
jgi:hypothetical protein